MLAFISLLGAAMSWLNWIEAINGFAWGPPMLILLAGIGLFLTLGLRCMTQRNIAYAFKMMWRGRRSGAGDEGDISAFNALMTALSATIGTGNIAGVATAIYFGGPGALFWMWVIALVGKIGSASCREGVLLSDVVRGVKSKNRRSGI